MSLQHIHDIRALLVKLEGELPSAGHMTMERENADRKEGVKEMADLKSAMENMGQTLRSVQAENKELKASLEKMGSTVAKLKKDNERLKTSVTVVEGLVENLRRKEEELVELKKGVDEMKGTFLAELGELKEQFTNFRSLVRGGKENTARFDGVDRKSDGEKREKTPRLTPKHHPKVLTAEEIWEMDRMEESELEDDNATDMKEHKSRSQPTNFPSSQRTLSSEMIAHKKKVVFQKEIDLIDLDVSSQSEDELSFRIQHTQFTSSRLTKPAANSRTDNTMGIFSVNTSKQNKRRTSYGGNGSLLRESLYSKKAKIVDDVGFTPVENKGRAESIEL